MIIKLLLAGLCAGLLWNGQAVAYRMGLVRWSRDRLGATCRDTLNWRQQGNYSLRDTLYPSINDTTSSEIEITGMGQSSLFWELLPYGNYRSSPRAGALVVEVSPDGNQDGSMWMPVKKIALPTYGKGMAVLLQGADTEEESRLRAGAFMRVRTENMGTGILHVVLIRTWGADPGRVTAYPAVSSPCSAVPLVLLVFIIMVLIACLVRRSQG